MIPSHLKPSMVFTPAKPRERKMPREEGVPLHAIDRRLLPGMRVVRHDGRAKSQAAWAAETAIPIESVVPIPIPIPNSIPNPNPNLAPAPDPSAAWEGKVPQEGVPLHAIDGNVSPTERNRGGRPRAITPEKRVQLLHILRRGQSRRHAAMRMGIDAASITRAIRRDPRLAIEVMEAEEEGQMFLEIWDRLYSLQETVLELQPVVSTPQLEREKEYLIRCGLPAEYVRRLRQRTRNDPPPPELPPDPQPFMQQHQELHVRPWKKGWRKKKVKAGYW